MTADALLGLSVPEALGRLAREQAGTMRLVLLRDRKSAHCNEFRIIRAGFQNGVWLLVASGFMQLQ